MPAVSEARMPRHQARGTCKYLCDGDFSGMELQPLDFECVVWLCHLPPGGPNSRASQSGRERRRAGRRFWAGYACIGPFELNQSAGRHTVESIETCLDCAQPIGRSSVTRGLRACGCASMADSISGGATHPPTANSLLVGVSPPRVSRPTFLSDGGRHRVGNSDVWQSPSGADEER